MRDQRLRPLPPVRPAGAGRAAVRRRQDEPTLPVRLPSIPVRRPVLSAEAARALRRERRWHNFRLFAAGAAVAVLCVIAGASAMLLLMSGGQP